MLHREPLRARRPRFGALAGLLALTLVSGPLAAMEEVTVNGAADAAVATAQQARFESQMDLYVATVGADFKAAVEAGLKRSIMPPVRLAVAGVTSRG